MNIKAELKRAAALLSEAGDTSPILSARILLRFVLKRDAVYLSAHDEYILTADEATHYQRLVTARCAHEPIAYLINEREFMGLSFYVDSRVLIPRPDTEPLCEHALSFIERQGGRLRVLDLCCGSGAIGLSLKHYAPNIEVTLSDISPDALSVARLNAERLSLDAAFLQSDLFENVSGAFDIIASNPPYITEPEMDELAPDIIQYEPHLALLGGADGLSFYRAIAKQAPQHLFVGGCLLLEIGCTQGEAVRALLAENGFSDITINNDLAGLPRFVCAVRSE